MCRGTSCVGKNGAVLIDEGCLGSVLLFWALQNAQNLPKPSATRTRGSVLESLQHVIPGRVPDEVNADDADTCGLDISIKWHARTSSAVYATPLITDLYSDGRRDIVAAAFADSVEVLEGWNGARVPDFEARHGSTAHTSPLLHDVDFDGVLDIVLGTYQGEIVSFKDNGQEAAPRFRIPPLKLHRNWYSGLATDHVDRSHPDVGGADGAAFKATTGRRRRLLGEEDGAAGDGQAAQAANTSPEATTTATGANPSPLATTAETVSSPSPSPLEATSTTPSPPLVNAVREALTGSGDQADSAVDQASTKQTVERDGHVISQEAADSYAELFGDQVGDDLDNRFDGPPLRTLDEGNIGRQERHPDKLDECVEKGGDTCAAGNMMIILIKEGEGIEDGILERLLRPSTPAIAL